MSHEEEAGRAGELIRVAGLALLPAESGYLGLIGESRVMVGDPPAARPVQSQVYYMLTAQRPVNFLHRLAVDDTHVLIEGGPVDYYIFPDDGDMPRRVTLARHGTPGVANGSPVVAVPAGSWKALCLHADASYALMANVLSPAFRPDSVVIGESEDWVAHWAAKSGWSEKWLRTLIGPNVR